MDILHTMKLRALAAADADINRAMRQLETMQTNEEAQTGSRDEDIHLIQIELLAVLEHLSALELRTKLRTRASAKRMG